MQSFHNNGMFVGPLYFAAASFVSGHMRVGFYGFFVFAASVSECWENVVATVNITMKGNAELANSVIIHCFVNPCFVMLHRRVSICNAVGDYLLYSSQLRRDLPKIS
jgi:hypothetical protein